jgi:hypothetical protein
VNSFERHQQSIREDREGAGRGEGRIIRVPCGWRVERVAIVDKEPHGIAAFNPENLPPEPPENRERFI